MKPFIRLFLACLPGIGLLMAGRTNGAEPKRAPPGPLGPVRVTDHALVDEGGPFLGLGVSYFTALWPCRHDRARLESDFRFLSKQGFNYYRMLSMVGWYGAWEGLEIAPVAFTNRGGQRIEV